MHSHEVLKSAKVPRQFAPFLWNAPRSFLRRAVLNVLRASELLNLVYAQHGPMALAWRLFHSVFQQDCLRIGSHDMQKFFCGFTNVSVFEPLIPFIL